jgi:hypothetical protein
MGFFNSEFDFIKELKESETESGMINNEWRIAIEGVEGTDYVYDYRVITKEQFRRLFRQQKTQYPYVNLAYTDELELIDDSKTISGVPPTLKGYYYLLAKPIPMTDVQITVAVNMGSTLFYGHSETGRIRITFCSAKAAINLSLPSMVRVCSADFYERFKQFVRFVDGQ